MTFLFCKGHSKT